MSVAVFIDVENIRYSALNNHSEREPNWAGIVAQCQGYGRISSFQAFGDWSKSPSQEVHEVQKCGIQPVFVPLSEWNKSSLDCYLIVAAMKLFFQNDSIDTLILGSGDRDYIPLVIELRALGKKVVIMSVEDTLSQDLKGSVDEVFFYKPKDAPEADESESRTTKEQGQRLLIENLQELESSSNMTHGYGWINLATLGHRLKSNQPDFSHKTHGYEKLVDMLKEIDEIELKFDGHEQMIAMVRMQHPAAVDGNSSATQLGTIINVKEENGYGFIKPDDGSEHIFFHYTKVISGDFYSLMYGDRVSYQTYNTYRGLNAERVNKIDSGPPKNPVLSSKSELSGIK